MTHLIPRWARRATLFCRMELLDEWLAEIAD